jgi:hypothetical protein
MTNAIQTGTILIEAGAAMPESLRLEGGAEWGGWRSVTNHDVSQLDTAIHQAGWTFFFMAGEIRITAFGWDKKQAARRAMKQAIRSVETQQCNCLEFTAVAAKSFLGMPYVNVSAHSRHIQKSSAFAGYLQQQQPERKL